MKPSGCTVTTPPAWAQKPTWQIMERPYQMSKYGKDILFAAFIKPKQLLGKSRQPPSLQTFPSFAQCPAAWRDPPSAKHAAGSKGPHSHGGLSQTRTFWQGGQSRPFPAHPSGCGLRVSKLTQLWSKRAGLTALR